MKALNLTGQRFGRLLVTGMELGGRASRAVCQCDCGQMARPLAYNLSNGNTTSCGCAGREARAARSKLRAPVMGHANRTHGKSKTRTYACWRDAINRCHLPTATRFPEYGARGVIVCDAWRASFEAFFADMGECPPGLTLERKDNAKGYEPGNCEWATREQQAQNRTWNKATPEIVKAMRARHAAGEGAAGLADEFGMSLSNAKLILGGKTWKNV